MINSWSVNDLFQFHSAICFNRVKNFLLNHFLQISFYRDYIYIYFLYKQVITNFINDLYLKTAITHIDMYINICRASIRFRGFSSSNTFMNILLRKTKECQNHVLCHHALYVLHVTPQFTFTSKKIQPSPNHILQVLGRQEVVCFSEVIAIVHIIIEKII